MHTHGSGSGPDPQVFRLLAALCGAQRRVHRPDAAEGVRTRALLRAAGPALVAQAVQHKVAATTLEALQDNRDSVPADVITELKRTATEAMTRRLLLLRVWRTVVDALESAGFRCLTLKGPATSIRLYGDAQVREYSDLDLLVDVEDFAAIVPVMEGSGYRIDGQAPVVGASSVLRSLFRQPHHIVFRHRRMPVFIEVHKSAFKRHSLLFPVGNDVLFARAVTVSYDGHAFATLGAVDHALYIVSHGIGHDWALLHWLLDAAVILGSDDHALHAAIAARTTEMGMERALSVTLLLLERVFGLSVPSVYAPMLDRRRRRVASSVEHCLRSLVSGGKRTYTFRQIIAHNLRHSLVVAERPRLRLLLVAQLFQPTAADRRAVPLPGPLAALYPALRPALVLYRRLRRVMERVLVGEAD